jgi:hypothetical protein
MIDDDEDYEALAQMVDDFQPGLYQHYKGQQYLALCLAREDETDEVVVVYTRLYARPGLPTSTRRLTIWNEEVEHEGNLVPRFSYCGHVTDEVDARGRPKQVQGGKGFFGWMKDNL